VAAVKLANRSSMSSNEAFSFVTEVNERRSSAKQVDFIKEREADLLDRIGKTGGAVLNRKPMGPKARLNIAMGSILNLPEDIENSPLPAPAARMCALNGRCGGGHLRCWSGRCAPWFPVLLRSDGRPVDTDDMDECCGHNCLVIRVMTGVVVVSQRSVVSRERRIGR
jgi:hypothetical protein